MDLEFSPEANADLQDIWHYIASDNSQAADKMIMKIKTACEAITQFPLGMGRVRSDVAQDTRSHAVDRYVVFYRSKADNVEVVRVLHSARDIPTNINS